MDKDKVCALCDAIDEAIDAAVAVTDLPQLKPHVNQYVDAIRSEVEKSEPLPEPPEIYGDINFERMKENRAKNMELLKKVMNPDMFPHVTYPKVGETPLPKSEVEKSPWIKVSDRLPEADDPVFVMMKYYDGARYILRACYAAETDNGWYEKNMFENEHWNIDGEVTHWMQLPETPEE